MIAQSCHSRAGGNPFQINNLVQILDARLRGHDDIGIFLHFSVAFRLSGVNSILV